MGGANLGSSLHSDQWHVAQDAEDKLPAWAQQGEEPELHVPSVMAEASPASEAWLSIEQQQQSEPFMHADVEDELPACGQSRACDEPPREFENSATPVNMTPERLHTVEASASAQFDHSLGSENPRLGHDSAVMRESLPKRHWSAQVVNSAPQVSHSTLDKAHASSSRLLFHHVLNSDHACTVKYCRLPLGLLCHSCSSNM